MAPFRELLDDLGAERRQVPSVAAGDEPLSTTTSASTHSPPALRMSVFTVGNDVSLRPFTTSASTNVQGPWQMTPTGLAC